MKTLHDNSVSKGDILILRSAIFVNIQVFSSINTIGLELLVREQVVLFHL